MASTEVPGVIWDEHTRAYRVRSHAAARHALADPHLDTTVGDSPRPAGSLADPSQPLTFLASWFSRSSRDRHLPIKRTLAPHFAMSEVRGQAAQLEELARARAAALPGHCDVAREYLRPFVLSSTARMLGIASRDEASFGKAVTALSAVLGRPTLDERGLSAVATCIRYLRQLMLDLSRQDSPRPLVAALCRLAGPAGDELAFGDAVSTLAQVLTAGFHPTVSGAAFAWRTLHEKPALLREVRRDADNFQRLTAEVLRLSPPFPYVHRWAHSACSCLGIEIPVAAHVIVDLRAANRDHTVYARASEVDLDREATPGLSFGHGAHRCLAPGLAQLQIAASLRGLLSLSDPPWPTTPTPSEEDSAEHLVLVQSLPCARTRSLEAIDSVVD